VIRRGMFEWLHFCYGSRVDLDKEAMAGELATDSLVHRYDPAASPAGLRRWEGPSRCAHSPMWTRSAASAGQLEKAATHEKRC
jgi:hypothetical protein